MCRPWRKNTTSDFNADKRGLVILQKWGYNMWNRKQQNTQYDWVEKNIIQRKLIYFFGMQTVQWRGSFTTKKFVAIH